MFDLLKKKLSNFVEKFSNKVRETKDKAREEKKEEIVQKRELKPELKVARKVKAVFKKEIRLKEADISNMLFELELSLLEADVNEHVAKTFCDEIKKRLLSEKVPAKDASTFIKERIKETLKELMRTEKLDLITMIKNSEKPFKILFLGPNGAGKTTTIAKLTFLLKKHGFSSIWAASDTFRAASIEQLAEHAKKLNVRLIKHTYGADPAAVAYDAINAAKSSNIDVVMIDTAGRQETNRNLIEELRKIDRVVKPNIKIFVGEAFAGKNLVEQAKQFDKALNIDAFIITKIDTDAKGGSTLSLIYELKKPVIFIGTGQSYADLKPFDAEEIIERII